MISADEFECERAFARYCTEELVDPRLREILEEAFVNGWVAHAVLTESISGAAALARRRGVRSMPPQ